jgi:hypothetical protein
MTATATKTNNRALTLAGANKLFSVIGVEIHQHEIGHYWCKFQGEVWEQPTLTRLCQCMLIQLNSSEL